MLNKPRCLTCLAALIATSAVPALAGNGSWNGTWILNQAKSRLTGDTFTYSKNTNGTLHFSGSAMEFNLACDGKDYSETANYTTACKKVSASVYDGTDKQNGKVLSRSQSVISPDGKTMTITSNGTRPDGTADAEVDTYERVSGTSGLVGEWKHVKSKSSAASALTIALSGNTITLNDPGYRRTVTARLDGKGAPMTGPTLPTGVTVAFRRLGPLQLAMTIAYEGKIVEEDTLTLSADAKTLTEVSWSPGQSSKQTSVYEKQ